jgi:glycosyltransferase involved in cell wall biosynthesis
MRVAVVTQSRDRVGGVEAYLQAVLPHLAERHDVTFWSASHAISDRGAIVMPPGVIAERFEPVGEAAGRQLRAWRPDVVFSHGLADPEVESAVLEVAPAVVVQHTYHGTCISSTKTMTWPVVSPCSRAFGPGCLAHYFPRRCGGSSPLTMTRLYRAQSTRLETLRRVAAVVTLSNHMAGEVRRNGVPAERVHVVPPFVDLSSASPGPRRPDETVRLLFLGRLEPMKGVRQLLDALGLVVARLDRPVSLVVAGDGAEREALERQAATRMASDARIQVRFTGWQSGAARAALLRETDALVVPSVWPEPFGLVGLEAAAAGVPAVAFGSGGILDWLTDGVNGCLAPAEGARPDALAEAIVRCVGSPATLEGMRLAAREGAAQWTIARHLARLDDVLQSAQQPVAVAHAS